MTPLEQQIALCQWAGWKPPEDCTKTPPHKWSSPEDGCCYNELPNTNSLDVLHEMFSKFRLSASLAELASYRDYLMRVVGLNPLYWDWQTAVEFERLTNATAAQRREALLRCLGLWREEDV